MAQEENIGFVNTVRNFLSVVFKDRTIDEPTQRTTELRSPTPSGGSWYKIMKKWYLDILTYSGNRNDKYDKYEFLDRNLSEASCGLNIYADNIVSGAIGGEENYSVFIDKTAINKEQIEAVVKEAEQRTKIKDYVWDIARDLTCFGDDFEELVIGSDGNGKYFPAKLKQLPPKEIFANVDERGVCTDTDFPYLQKRDEWDKEGTKFDWWRLIHFKLGRDVYGVNKSIFANASQRIGRQLLWIDDSMVLARMTRAWMRYAFHVDTTGMSSDDAWDFAEKWLERVKRKEVIDRDTGRLNISDSPPLPDEDMVIPTKEGTKQGVEVLSGDMNIGNIEDVKYFQSKFLMALNIPKAYVGLEEGVRSKATLGQIDIQFARQVRRRQTSLIPGLKRFYELTFILAGLNPMAFRWDIVFPELATTDELLKYEMLRIKADIAKIFATDIGALNNMWIYTELLGFTEEEIENYALVPPGETSESYTQLPSYVADMIRKDPYVRQLLDDLKDIIVYKTDRDNKVEGMKSVGEEREEELRDRWER